ncbi:flagellar hook-associated protein FlgL [Caldimonas brevitalea]|uniref:Flagellar hook protein FlgL n=1 Tax=Caldimonas brevitalea TaxID=413882 RepID=A0A0G3BQT4_9BURK|nr:flagellar hook-associated protein FlgL [Caldimonas brevitalea]AKJ30343.1 flagellar hook protein FlgL [Caldimonas brevitalea]
MRIASAHYHATMNTALQTASSKVADVMHRMATGQHLLKPSDDPVRQVRLSRLMREDAALTQYRDNIGALRSRLQQNETLLDGMSRDMLQARDLLVWAADGGNTSEDVGAMADSLAALRDSLFYSVNSRDQEGRYLFSGTATATPALTYDPAAAPGARYSFTGNTEAQKVMVGNGVTQTANVSLQEMHGLLNLLDQTVATLATPGVRVSDPAAHAQLSAAIDGLDAGLDAVNVKIAGLGGAQNLLSTLDTNHQNVSLSNQQAVLKLGQLDYGDAAVQLNGYTTALQATQKAYGQVSRLSLFDVL